MTGFRGGEQVVIRHNGQPVHTFERIMSDALQRHREAEYEAGDHGQVIDLWRLVTPMPRQQQKKLPPLPAVDPTAPLAERIHQINERLKQIDGRKWA